MENLNKEDKKESGRKDSIKLLFQIVAYDILSIIFSAGILALVSRAIYYSYDKLSDLGMENLAIKSQDQLQEMASSMGWTIKLLVASFIFGAVFLITNWSFFQQLIYSKILNKKITLKSFGKFLLLNLGWMGLFIGLLFLVYSGFKESIVLPSIIVLTAFFIYFTNILYLLFIKDQNWDSIKKAFKLGVFYFPIQLLPCLLMVIIVYGLFRLNQMVLFSLNIFIENAPFIILSLIAIDLTRLYIANIIKKRG
ncbi:MAG: hypothetical protein ABIJ08_02890 [Nanoarchaeota archaeon]